ncbi:hypothetical protein CDAR_459491 [Caerostris darwini]|uniref:Uncharacterized protein n=1 Tax=Caerostris darwini TaxID=1538125 RepID=A0AAV4PXU6_9ARAC|nr:hypothetical protein CDAR_459491 [Caerostris darwini]
MTLKHPQAMRNSETHVSSLQRHCSKKKLKVLSQDHSLYIPHLKPPCDCYEFQFHSAMNAELKRLFTKSLGWFGKKGEQERISESYWTGTGLEPPSSEKSFSRQ